MPDIIQMQALIEACVQLGEIRPAILNFLLPFRKTGED